jgi:hypothetical protein
MAKLWDEGFKELPTNRKGIALFSPVDKAVTELGLLRYPRFRDSVQTQRCSRVLWLLLCCLADSVVDDGR